CLQIATVLGPLFGLMIGSYCAQLYVDVGFIDLEEVTISLTDSRWVGAWWLGVLICAAVNFLVAVPFCFLPKSLPMEGEEHSTDVSAKGSKSFLPTDDTSHAKVNVREIVKDFIPYLKSLFHNPIYMLFLCITVIQFNAYIGMITFMPKYLEQQDFPSRHDKYSYITVYNLPIICAGYFFGGLMMKKFKISTYKAAHIGFWSSVIEYLLYFTAFLMVCKNTSVAGLTVSYEGIDQLSYVETNLYADCNRGCDCSTKLWDPVCGDNGIAYVSACLAGCEVSNGTGKNTVLGNCSCVASPGFPFGNGSALPGQCGREDTCGTMLHYFLILSLVCCLIYSFGAMPGYMVLIRYCSGIPSPIYFGAMIDTTCLKWGTKSCGGEGACRMYDSDMYRSGKRLCCPYMRTQVIFIGSPLGAPSPEIFLIALAFSYFAKGFSGSYMKSMMTQIERRFEISSSVTGLIDGSFELGNLLVMILVSYLGPKIHRPKVIGIGCIIMSIGAFVSVVPHFIMGRYNYKSIAFSTANASASVSACSAASPPSHMVDDMEGGGDLTTLECEKTTSSYLWMFVLAGNLLRGVGEAPIMPLGMSYIDDFSTEENSAFYIGIVRSFGLFGPTLGFLLGSFCANLWVDIGAVNVDTLTINSKDMRWVGAWWLGILIAGGVSLVASLPFWFLPYSLPKENKKTTEVFTITKSCKADPPEPSLPQLKVSEAVKEFFLL
ncbi:hypothetical protein JRQ81_015408, partial [Phrynocephalus forsythii]